MWDEEWWKIWWWNMNLRLGAIWTLCWCVLNWIGLDIDLIEFDLILILNWIRVWFDLIKTLWDCKQVNVGFEWKSNGDDNAPMSKVEDVMQSWIRRRCE